MLRKIVTAVIVIPLAVIIVGFAVANRQAITVSFDPFDAAQPAYAVTLPLFVIIFILMIIGVIVGGIAAWLRQGAWRRSSRQLDAEVRRLREELAAARALLTSGGATELRADNSPPMLTHNQS